MDITPLVIADFRDYFPEFSDPAEYPDTQLNKFLWLAEHETGSTRWGRYNYLRYSFKVRGLFNYAAHALTIDKMRLDGIARGGAAISPARVSSKSVGDESTSYAVPTPTSDELVRYGDLTTTVYGLEFLRLRQRAGMGAVVV